MDREKVIKELENAPNTVEHGFYFLRITHRLRDDALALLKEQEAVKPYIDIDEAKCPICKVRLTRQELIGDDVLFEDFFDYCPHCGRQVKWDA